MFKLNKTKQWRDGLSKSDLNVVMERARKSVKTQKKDYFHRKQQIHNEKVEKTRQEAAEKSIKAQNQAALREELTIQIQEKYNGLWVDKNQVEQELSKLETVKSKREALKTQLDFRNKVLQMKCDTSLFFLSSKGKNKSIEKLTNNLLTIIEEKEVQNSVKTTCSHLSFSEPVIFSQEMVKKTKRSHTFWWKNKEK